MKDLKYLWAELEERWEPQSDEEREHHTNCLLGEVAVKLAEKQLDEWGDDGGYTLEAYQIEKKNVTQAVRKRGLSQEEKVAFQKDREEIEKAMQAIRLERDKLKQELKVRRRRLRELKSKDKEPGKKSKRAARRLRAEIEEDILKPLGIESSSYHGGALAGNAIRRLMEEAEGVAIGVKQKLRECGIDGRNDEIDAVTTNIHILLSLLDAVYSLLMTKYGMVTVEILADLEELLELLRLQWVKMGLPMTPKFHILLKHALAQLRESKGGLSDLAEDYIERSHQERLKDSRRIAGLRTFERRTDSQVKMQYIRQLVSVTKIQKTVNDASRRNLKRDKPLATEQAEGRKAVRHAKCTRAADYARNDATSVPPERARALNMKDVKEGKTIEHAKP